MDNKKMELQKLSVRKMGTEAEALNLGAQVVIAQWDDESEMMDSALKWINETEKVIQDLPDVLEQKALMLKYLRVARQSHENNDPVQTIRWFPVIRENCAIATKIVLPELIAKKSGAKGGSKSKRKEWAEILANKLNDECPGITKDECWLKIPESYEPREIETNEADYQVYRDEEDLIAINTVTTKETKLRKETFFSEYFKKRK